MIHRYQLYRKGCNIIQRNRSTSNIISTTPPSSSSSSSSSSLPKQIAVNTEVRHHSSSSSSNSSNGNDGSSTDGSSNKNNETTTTPSPMGGGIGYHNVRDRILVSEQSKFVGQLVSSDSTSTASSSSILQKKKHCTVIGAPMTYGQPYIGTDTSPNNLRALGLIDKLQQLQWNVTDHDNLPFDTYIAAHEKGSRETSNAAATTTTTTTETNPLLYGNAKNNVEVGMGTYHLAEMVSSTLSASASSGRSSSSVPVILGGDHSIGIGSLAGIVSAIPNIGILWIDAHADINTPYTTESGNMHGMPIGFLMEPIMQRTYQQYIQRLDQQHHQSLSTTSSQHSPDATSTFPILPGFEWLYTDPKYQHARIQPNQLVYIGLRDIDIEERKLITSLHIPTYTMTEIDRYGIGKVLDMALDHLKGRPIHCSYDIDVVDPILAPATGTTVRGGLTFREALYVAEAIAASDRLVSAEIVELNPMLSNETGANETVELGLQIILSLMGKSIL